ncbi:Mediator of RNA polymerase II transcription subunit 6 [Puccinia graminis f. sp. tritici]|uniref:Mediator of RNA polymerase II transcription subunit 6 n=1 Tax=Puccinia graminis f. sp. tritici TaxID=56615 RepID=A0A5B0QH21_PUCGR|nr:Mediator of RNA polymerase II transcription subunit 6 [Puccinia graminis f. sp. tritici]
MTSTIAGLPIPDSDLCHVQWRSLAWILEHGPLTESNAIDYFALSPFYDRKSTNQVLRMQSMFSGQPKMDPASEQEALRRFIGIEYALVLSRPEPDREGGLFIIEKRERKGYDEYYPIASYYILKTSIYQAPSLYATLSARVLTSLSALQRLLELARQHKPTYDPRHSYAWKIKEKPEENTVDKQSTDQPTTESTNQIEPTTQESDRMDIDMTAPEQPDGPAKTTLKKKNHDTPELSNPILFRALQNTITNFPAFKPPPAVDAVPE